MSEPNKTFKVRCASCQRPFHVRFPLAKPSVSGSGEVVVACLYCEAKVAITIPRQYIEDDAMVRGLPSRMLDV